MSWYLVKLIFHIDIEAYSSDAQFHESFRIILADNPEEALEKSRKAGHEEESSFRNSSGDLVKWVFIDVHYLQPLNALSDGNEIYSATLHDRRPENFIRDVRMNAVAISTHYLHS